MTTREDLHSLVERLPEAELDRVRHLLEPLTLPAAVTPGLEMLGLFADEPELMDQIVEDAMRQRERPWRTG